MRSYSIEDDPTLDLNVKQMDYQLPMHALHLSRSIYENYPWFQREQVWPGEYQFELIKSIVQGAFIPSILTTPMPSNSGKKWVVDGQQRLRTMMDFMSALECDLRHEPIPRYEDGHEYFYFRLTPRQQQRFMSALVRFTDIFDVTEEQLTTIFLRLQNQMTLKTAERLWATTGRMREVAAQIMKHPYFETIYDGKKLRMQPYQMAMYPVALEMYPPFADASGSRLMDLAKRKVGDKLLSSSAEVTIWGNLEAVCHLFHGVKSNAMTEIIIQYQCVWFLRFLGANIERSPRGALVEWYRNVEQMNNDYRLKGFMNLFAQFPQAKSQKKHWSKWLEEIVYSQKLDLGKKEETLAQLQRVTGWLRSNGVCSECNHNHVQLLQIEQHCFRPADAHDSNRVTCKNKAKIVAPVVAAW